MHKKIIFPKNLKQTIPCSCCSEQCSGKLLIRSKKKEEYPLCTECFNSYIYKDEKELMKRIRENE